MTAASEYNRQSQENINGMLQGMKDQRHENTVRIAESGAAIVGVMYLFDRWQQNRAARRAAQQEGEAR